MNSVESVVVGKVRPFIIINLEKSRVSFFQRTRSSLGVQYRLNCPNNSTINVTYKAVVNSVEPARRIF